MHLYQTFLQVLSLLRTKNKEEKEEEGEEQSEKSKGKEKANLEERCKEKKKQRNERDKTELGFSKCERPRDSSRARPGEALPRSPGEGEDHYPSLLQISFKEPGALSPEYNPASYDVGLIAKGFSGCLSIPKQNSK